MAVKGSVGPVTSPPPGPTAATTAARSVLRRRRRGVASRPPAACSLALPDLAARRSTTDRGVFSADRVDPGTKLPAARRAARRRRGDDAARPRLRLRPDRRAPWPGGRPTRTVWAVDVNERARRPVRAPTPTAAGRRRPGARSPTPDDVPADVAVRRHLVEPADPHRQGRAARAARRLARPAAPRRRRPTSSCRSTSAPTRSPAWLDRAGLADRAPRLAGRLPAARRRPAGRRTPSGREAARQHRAEAAAPRVAPAHRRAGSPCCSTACRRRSTSARSCGPRRPMRVDARVARSAPPPIPDHARTQQDRARLPALPHWTVVEVDRRPPPRRRAAGYRVVGIELADGAVAAARGRPRPATSAWSSATRTAASPRPRLGRLRPVAYLPQLGRIGSLNVATAAAIALYEVRRRAWTLTANPLSSRPASANPLRVGRALRTLRPWRTRSRPSTRSPPSRSPGTRQACACWTSPTTVEWMQSVAGELNLAETAFAVRRDDGDHDLRWFTPTGHEVDLCGHATLATAHVLGGAGRFHTRSGLLTCTPGRPRHDRDGLPGPARSATVDDPPDWAAGARRRPRPPSCRCGTTAPAGAWSSWRSPTRSARPSRTSPRSPRSATACSSSPPAIRTASTRCRAMFAPGVGIDEDPVTGSSFTTIGPWLAQRTGGTMFVGEQASARGGTVGMRVEGDRVVVIGRAVTVIEGTIASDPPPA